MNAIETQLEQAWLKYSTETVSIARMQFIQFVKPYCDQKGYRFNTGMGEWLFTGISEEDVPKRLQDILNMQVEGFRYSTLGGMMPSYDPFKP